MESIGFGNYSIVDEHVIRRPDGIVPAVFLSSVLRAGGEVSSTSTAHTTDMRYAYCRYGVPVCFIYAGSWQLGTPLLRVSLGAAGKLRGGWRYS